jgi:hypothetical protein
MLGVPSLPEYRILTVRQPWAWALVTGRKDVENRTWKTNYRGLLFVHAAQKPDRDAAVTTKVPAHLPLSAVVGSVHLVDVVQHHQSQWAEPQLWHWVVDSPREFDEPIPMPGRLGLWRVVLPRRAFVL